MAKGKNRLRKTILGIAIAILLVFFLGYAVNTLYKPPKYQDYCTDVARMMPDNQDSCEAAGGTWNAVESPKAVPLTENMNCEKISEEGDAITLSCQVSSVDSYTGYCDYYSKCQDAYDARRESHGRVSFTILVILGLLSVVAGAFALKVEAVGSGIMGGGVLTLIYGTIRFWGSIEDYVRLAILGIALGVLIWLGYRRFKD